MFSVLKRIPHFTFYFNSVLDIHGHFLRNLPKNMIRLIFRRQFLQTFTEKFQKFL